MPSSKRYLAKRKAKGGKPNPVLRHEEARRKKLHGTKSDPKASRVKVERARLRKKLGLKKGNKATAGHIGNTKLSKRKLGKKPLRGKKQPAKTNYAAGGRLVKGKTKAVAKKGKGYSGRKKSV